MVHIRYTLEIINAIVGAILALLRGWIFMRWFGKGLVRVGAGVVLGGVGTLASPSVPEPPHTDESPFRPGRRKRPHSTQHSPRPYADNERDMAGHVAAQKPTAVSDLRGRPENLTITRTAHSDDQ